MPEDAFGGTYSTNTLKAGPHSAHQFLGVFATNAEITGMKAAKGSVAFSIQSGNGRLYIYNGSAWKYISADG